MRILFKVFLASTAIFFFAVNLLQADDRQPDLSTGQKAESQGPAKPQSTCPVMGGEIGPIDKALYVDVKGKRVYICCAACESAILADPDMYIKKIEKRGESVADTPKSCKTP